jgi:hypothetical protein
VQNHTYSVPARLIGERVRMLLHHDQLEVYYAGQLVDRLPRIRGRRSARIDYHHVIWSLVKKPGAFARYRWREELFPTLVFRRAYDALRSFHGERADGEYVRILHMAATLVKRWSSAPCSRSWTVPSASTPTAFVTRCGPSGPVSRRLRSRLRTLRVYDGLLVEVGS